MPHASKAIVDTISDKITILASQRDAALRKAAALEEEANRLRQEVKELEQTLGRARVDIEYLTLSHKLADSPRALDESRRLLRALIRKVDRAISLVKADPAD